MKRIPFSVLIFSVLLSEGCFSKSPTSPGTIVSGEYVFQQTSYHLQGNSKYMICEYKDGNLQISTNGFWENPPGELVFHQKDRTVFLSDGTTVRDSAAYSSRIFIDHVNDDGFAHRYCSAEAILEREPCQNIFYTKKAEASASCPLFTSQSF